MKDTAEGVPRIIRRLEEPLGMTLPAFAGTGAEN